MASLNFNHAHSQIFNEENVSNIEDEVIGNYALGYVKNSIFIPKYVGRSDNDLKGRLKNHLKNPEVNYKRFKFMYQTSSRNAYLKECENYHNLKNSINNKIHPARPVGTKWKCPKTSCNE